MQQMYGMHKKKSREWKVRLQEEIRTDKTGKFVTLTFNEESLEKLKNEISETPTEYLGNEIATLATRRFLERWRKKYKTSIKHWLITELGHKSTERIHLHGIIFTDKPNEISNIWNYGYTYIGQYVNEKTINYITKYVTKIDTDHKWYTPKILTSAGIGKNYINRPNAKNNTYKEGGKTSELYTTRGGSKLAIPIYYRNKIYSEEEREKLWIEKLNKEERFVNGIKIDISTPEGEETYNKMIKDARTKNKRLGYGEIDYKPKEYEKILQRIKKLTKDDKNHI